ncbi:hypothetical protein SPRG_16994 [Saprolegnia parasitica CBS 223.65]|uniref:FYVE-type domain-containing protein n=1 Tax=Saprolegnia parasitica (strain CBS 223.65) TaxID=695850 RepID=A0A067BT45_SAPPC|nr:hypothetical protein SPRG_16994 [Saprolegnia parasitica CBS 223.65]KDO17461.1 hypothetical protein SPRG_16994 [Saprolegnia parasitica CBS 223.65]|eukprot:XP_012211830.1 hypothetical protein SPRG_16994 [Saprolegnia parasitica CBS 223.65]
MALPLPSDFFTCPPLSPGDHGTLLAQAERLCHDTVLNAITMARAPPTKVLVNEFTKRRAQLHAGTDIYTPEHYGITGSSQIKASYDELFDFFHLNSDEKLRNYSKVIGQAVVDRQTLYTLSAPGSTSPMHASVQWSVIACPFISSAITLKRDSCFLEVLDTITFDDKATGRSRRGFVRAIHSIALDCCPSLRQSHSIVRSSFVRSGHVFLETNVPGLFDHYFAYVIGDPGATPKFFNLKVCERMVGQMLNLEPHLALKRLPALLLGGGTQRPSYRSTARIAYCESCDTKFQFLRSKHHCYHCRQIVCRRCIQAYKVPVPESENAPVVRLCTYCFCGNTPQRSMRGNNLGARPAHHVCNGPRHDSVDDDARWTNNRPLLEPDGSSSEASYVTVSYSAATPRFLLDLGDSLITSSSVGTVQLYHQCRK